METMPGRPRPDECAEYYHRYIAAAGEPLLESLEREPDDWDRLLDRFPSEMEGHRYAQGKWSVREVVAHVIDAERMFTMRVLAFARGDRARFPSFDQDEYAAECRADCRSLGSLAEELRAVRRSTVLLLGSFEDDVWDRRGVASGKEFTVRSLAWIIAGHSAHHRWVLTERYLGWGFPARAP
jgi:uncharacterized damage-inducible protein DinB